MPEWTTVAHIHDIPVGTGKEIIVQGRVVAVFNVDGTPYALDGVCPHAGGPLGEGTLTGCIVTCPWHGWQFDVTSGRHSLNPNLTHGTCPVRISGEDIQILLPDSGESANHD